MQVICIRPEKRTIPTFEEDISKKTSPSGENPIVGITKEIIGFI